MLATSFALAAVAALPVRAQSSPSAQSPRRMTFDDVIALRSVSDAQLSPDGKTVAYVVTHADLEQNASDADLWMVPATGGEPVRLTTSKKSDTSPR
ncbi:MAG: S9 family peptidase, partial [Betaproteobacteria bacterium]